MPLKIPDYRLFQAADAILFALASPGGFNGMLNMSLAGVGEGMDAPTRNELIEAYELLVRLGYIERATPVFPAPPKRPARPPLKGGPRAPYRPDPPEGYCPPPRPTPDEEIPS